MLNFQLKVLSTESAVELSVETTVVGAVVLSVETTVVGAVVLSVETTVVSTVQLTNNSSFHRCTFSGKYC